MAGLPSDTSATAVGFSADGKPWVLFWRQNGGGLPDADFWVAVGHDADYPGGSPQAVALIGDTAGFIVEHEVVV